MECKDTVARLQSAASDSENKMSATHAEAVRVLNAQVCMKWACLKYGAITYTHRTTLYKSQLSTAGTDSAVRLAQAQETVAKSQREFVNTKAELDKNLATLAETRESLSAV